MVLTTRTVRTDVGEADFTISDEGRGHTVLLLHGGAGPDSVAGFGHDLAAAHPARW
jgi:hypothetical protein